MLQSLKSQLLYAEDILHDLEDFRNEKLGMERKNQELVKTIKDMKKQHELNVQSIINDNSKERSNLEDRMNSMLDKVRMNASEMVTEDMGLMLENIMSDHVKLRKQIKTQLNVIHNLVKEKEDNERIIDLFKSDIKLFQSREKKLTTKIQQIYEENQTLEKETNTMQRSYNKIHMSNSKDDVVEECCPPRNRKNGGSRLDKLSSLHHPLLDSTSSQHIDQSTNETILCEHHDKGEESPSLPLHSNNNKNKNQLPRIIHRPNKMQRYFIRRGKDLSKAEELLISAIVRIMYLEEHKPSYDIHKKTYTNIPSNKFTIGNPHNVRLLLLSIGLFFVFLFPSKMITLFITF